MILIPFAVLAAIGGAAAGWLLTSHRGHVTPTAVPSAARPTSTVSSSPAVSPSAATPQPSGLPGSASSGLVTIGPRAASQASASQVAAFLGTYFAAINHRDYDSYVSLFDSQQQPVPSRQQFLAGYRSTRDSGATLTRLSPMASGVAASLTFDSHQKPRTSASHTACTNWHITLFLESSGTSYLIGKAPAGYHACSRPCP